MRAICDDILRRIAHLDYGNDADEHFEALKGIRDSGDAPQPLGWIPLEVLGLAMSVSAGQQTYYGSAAVSVDEAHLIGAFACAVLLRDSARRATPNNSAGNVELCRLLTALEGLGPSALAAGISFVALAGAKWPEGADSNAFFAVAMVWLILRCAATVPESEISQLVEFAIAAEAKELAFWGKGLGPHPEHWLVGTTVYGNAKKCWQRIGNGLRACAEALPGTATRREVLRLGNLLALGHDACQ